MTDLDMTDLDTRYRVCNGHRIACTEQGIGNVRQRTDRCN